MIIGEPRAFAISKRSHRVCTVHVEYISIAWRARPVGWQLARLG